MKTLFKQIIKKTLFPGAFFFALLLVLPVNGKALKIFQAHKQKICQADSICIDGYVFARGTVPVKNVRKQIGFSKAKVEALGKLTYYLRERVDWPKSFSPEFRKTLWHEYQNLIETKLSVHTLVTVWENYEDKKTTTIVAIAENLLDQKEITWEELKNKLIDPANCRSGKIHLSVSLEICNESEYPAVLAAYAEKLSKDYGPNVAKMILEENAVSYSPYLSDCDLKTLSTSQLAQLLIQSPYTPEICYWLGQKLSGAGLNKSAQIFWRCGSRAVAYDPKYAQMCLEKVRDRSKLSILPTFPAHIYESICGKSVFNEPQLNFLTDCPGMFPVGTNKPARNMNIQYGYAAWKNGKIDIAYDSFKMAAAAEMTFEACNMAGYAGRLLGHNMEAAAFLLQAAILNPESVYPWIHLAWIYRSLKLQEQEQYCISRIKAAKNLDDWSKKELQKLTGK